MFLCEIFFHFCGNPLLNFSNEFVFNFQLIYCGIFAILVVIPCGKALLLPPTYDLITFGEDNSSNDILYEDDIIIPVPKPISSKRKGKTASGEDCFCVKVDTGSYLPPEINHDCICKKNCCKPRPPNAYLPPEDCEICPKCYCDPKTYTLVNKEYGQCPILCR